MSMLTPLGVGGRLPGRPRRRRRHLPLVMAVLVVLAGAVAVTWFLVFGGDAGERADAAAVDCTPTPTPTAPAVKTGSFTLHVFNAGDQNGLAATTAKELRSRGFRVGAVDNELGKVEAPALVRFGPKGRAQAEVISAHVPGATAAEDKRKDTSVDLVLGDGFPGLAAPTDAAAVLTPPPPAPCPSPTG